MKIIFVKVLLTIYFVNVVLFTSCQGDEPDSFGPEQYEIAQIPDYSDPLIGYLPEVNDEPGFQNPYQIININDEFLIVAENREDELFMVFSLPNLDFLYSWGRMGQGPGEFQFMPIEFSSVRGRDLIQYDAPTRNLNIVTVSDTGVSQSENYTLQYEGQQGLLNRVRRVHDNLYIADFQIIAGEKEYEFVALKPDVDNALYYFSEHPETELESADRLNRFMKTTAVKPGGAKFVSFYIYMNIIRLFEPESGEELQSFRLVDADLPDDIINLNEFISHDEEMIYRVIQDVSGSFIYTRGINGYVSAYYTDAYQPSIEIWDWNGRPLYRARFDHPVFYFTVSEEHGKLYAICATPELHYLCIYDLPDEIGAN